MWALNPLSNNSRFLNCLLAVVPCLLLSSLSFCSPTGGPDRKKALRHNNRVWPLDQFQILYQDKWVSTRPVPWNYPPEKGGPGIRGFLGTLTYRFRLPDFPKQTGGFSGYGPAASSLNFPGLGNQTTGIFFPCLDDADQLWYGSHLLGQTGQFPDPKLGINARAATRQSRVYPLPHNLLFSKERPFLELRVFNFAGDGGFCYAQQPLVGPYQVLLERARRLDLENDLPRTVASSLILVTIISLSVVLVGLPRKKRGWSELPGWLFMACRFGGAKHSRTAVEAPGAPVMITILLAIFMLVFLISELSFKYTFFPLSENWWFKAPPISFCLGAFCLLLLMRDGFTGNRRITSPGAWGRIYLLAGHPAHPLIFALYLSFLPAPDVWQQFTLIGLFYWFLILSITFIHNLVFTLRSRPPGEAKRARAQLGLTLGGLLGVLIWLSEWGSLRRNSFLIMIIFFMGYAVYTIHYMFKTGLGERITREFLQPETTRIKQALPAVTSREARTLELVCQGLSNREIARQLGLSEQTVRNRISTINRKLSIRGGRAELVRFIRKILLET